MFHKEALLGQGTKVYLVGLDHVSKMAAMSIFGKNSLNLLLQNTKAKDFKTLCVALDTRALQNIFKDDPALTLS